MKKISKNVLIFILGGIVIGSLGVYAATQINSKDVIYKDEVTVESAINDLYDKSKNYNVCNANRNITATKKCKRAEYLHQETCANYDVNNPTWYCSGAEYPLGSTITYGNCGTSGTLTTGDAFDCDVNGDGIYDRETERFYYVSDYYNTETKQFENDTAVLIYYNNILGGVANNRTTYAYDNSGENWHGPESAKLQLPTTTQWSNVSLKNTNRVILNPENGNTTDKGNNKLPGTDDTHPKFNYEGYAARLLTHQEVSSVCGTTKDCKYLEENTNFSHNLLSGGYWLETPHSNTSHPVLFIYSNKFGYAPSNTYPTNNMVGVRPVIDVSITDIEY